MSIPMENINQIIARLVITGAIKAKDSGEVKTWLMALSREVWEEGYAAGNSDGELPPVLATPNPYK